jgi:hypothetical protein
MVFSAKKTTQIDPLFIILEQHLCNFQDPDIDRKAFIAHVIVEYLSYLRKRNITVPRSLEQPLVEELANQVNTMLVKRIYGCLSLQDFQKTVTPQARRRAKARHSKLNTKLNTG